MIAATWNVGKKRFGSGKLRSLQEPENGEDGFFFLEIQQSEIEESGQRDNNENVKVKCGEKKRESTRKKG